MGRINKRKRRLLKLVAVLLLLAAAAGALFLFQVRKVTVYGNSRHSSEEISAGLTEGTLMKNTLYLLWKYREREVPDTLPFLSSLHVQMKSPSHIEVQVTEKELAGYIDKGGYVYFDRDGVILEVSDESYDGIPIITGVSIVGDAVLYQKLPTESSAQLRTILSLTQLLSYQKLDASEIRFGENMEITVFIEGVEAELGQDEYLEEKIANLNKILPKLSGKSGILHLENFTGRNETVSFTPSDEPNTVTDVMNGTSAGSEDNDTVSGGDTGQEDGSSVDTGGSAEGGDGDTGEGSAEGTVDEPEEQDTGVIFPMVFNSSGTLVYNVHISNGVVVDEYGSQVPGVTINEDGNVVDAYMNVFDSTTGELIQ
ncbi:MAG: cell division protein FtsQ/DivIB [Lachnospiraceae bacterium]|nr:cell division protein FtsQ/DivIB [Lachnospiraceae bacterium]